MNNIEEERKDIRVQSEKNEKRKCIFFMIKFVMKISRIENRAFIVEVVDLNYSLSCLELNGARNENYK